VIIVGKPRPEQRDKPQSKYNIGMKAFDRIVDLLNDITSLGHMARTRMRNRTIFQYFCAIETAYIPIRPAMKKEDIGFIEEEIKNIKKNDIDMINRIVITNKLKLVDKLTELEKKLYDSMQDIGMYIQLEQIRSKKSARMALKEHIQGTGIPIPDDDFL